ncbi:hypothetical protein EVA_12090 [gut metagenome]|uniref:Uncharacterized protein n=1 Tax=gut metagenome TaxID=749906 RepID=J9GJP1_9ZZZZ
MQILKGAKITKLRLGAMEGMKNVYLFIRPALNKPAISKLHKVSETTYGWNEVTLEEPFTVTGDEIFLAFNAELPAGLGLLFSKEQHANAGYVNDGQQWTDVSTLGIGAMYLQAEVEAGADIPQTDFAIEAVNLKKKFLQIGDTLEAEITISNYGIKPAPLPAICHTIEGGAPLKWEKDTLVEPGKTLKLNRQFLTDNMHEGYNKLNIWLDTDDRFKQNDSMLVQIPCYKTAYPRKTLIEHFTTLPCTNCPLGLKVLSKLTEGRKDYVWVAHHVGFEEDELTVKDSYYLLDPIGASGGVPAASFDRTVLPCSNSPKQPCIGIGYSATDLAVKKIQPGLDAAVHTPAFLSIDIENQYNEATRELITTVKGCRNKLLPLFYADNFLTVELVEEGVETKGCQVGSGAKVHSHVFRTALSKIKGDALQWNDDHFETTYRFTLPNQWNADKLRVVAFAHRSLDNAKTDIQVLNANDCWVTSAGTTGIKDASLATGNVTSREYYNLQGQRIARPAKGIYLEKVITANGSHTYKHVK